MRRFLILLLICCALAFGAQAEGADWPLFPAKGTNGLYGYINAQAEWVIAPQFSGVSDFRGDYACAWMVPEDLSPVEQEYYALNEDCEGIIDRHGNWVIPPEYSIDPGYGGDFYGGRDTGIWIIAKYDTPKESHLEGFFDIPSGYFSGLRWPQIWPWLGDGPLIPVTDAETWLYGYADRSTGELVIPYRYGYLDESAFFEGVASVAYERDQWAEGEKWPFFLINERGEVIPLPEGIHAAYESSASEGLIMVTDEAGRWGYVDLTGRVVIAPQFYEALWFEDGKARVRREKNEPYVYIDRTGAVIEGLSPDEQDYMDNGLAWVSCDPNDVYGGGVQLIDCAGNVVSEPYRLDMFESRSFDEGLQPVCSLDDDWLYLDNTGAVAIPGPYTYALPFRNGLAWVCDGNIEGYIDREGNPVYFWPRELMLPAKGENGLYGYIYTDGTWAIEPQFMHTEAFGDGLYTQVVCASDSSCTAFEGGEDIICEEQWNIIDRNGRLMLEPEYFLGEGGFDSDWNCRYSVVFANVDGQVKEGFFDLYTGTFSGLRWNMVWPYCSDNGLVAVFDAQERYGYADLATGEMVLPIQYDGQFHDPGEFCEGVAVVSFGKDDLHLMNLQGEEIPLPEGIHLYDHAEMHDGRMPVRDDTGLYGYIDPTGQMRLKGYQMVTSFENGRALVSFDTNMLYIAPDGMVLSDFELMDAVMIGPYRLVTPFEDGVAFVVTDTQQGYIDRNGNPLLLWDR